VDGGLVFGIMTAGRRPGLISCPGLAFRTTFAKEALIYVIENGSAPFNYGFFAGIYAAFSAGKRKNNTARLANVNLISLALKNY
jgi:hypothetical protein